MTARRSDDERRAARQRQILVAAEACFQRHGFQGASMADIATAARMSTGHIYHYFASKDAILAAVIESVVARDADLLLAKIRRLKARAEAWRNPIADIFCLCNSKPPWSGLLVETFAEASRNPAIATLLRQQAERLYAALRTVLPDGENPAVPARKAPPDRATVALLVLCHGAIMHRAAGIAFDRRHWAALFRVLTASEPAAPGRR